MTQGEFKKGERVFVKNTNMVTWVERIFLCEYQGKYYGKRFKNGFDVFAYDEIKKIEPVYRLLNNDDDRIMMGDEFFNFKKNKWEAATFFGKPFQKNLYRRKIKTYEE